MYSLFYVFTIFDSSGLFGFPMLEFIENFECIEIFRFKSFS